MIGRMIGLCVGALLLSTPLPAASPSAEEGLFVRRIVELWKGGDYTLAKRQMRQFLQEYPESPYRDRLMLVAGDQEYREGRYVEAIGFYEQIGSKEFRTQSFDRYVDSLYHAKEYPRVIAALKGHLPPPQQKALSPVEAAQIYQYAEALNNVQRHKEAVGYYERLFDTALDKQARLSAAGGYVGMDDPQTAAKIYLALAEELPDQREALLLRAAQLQVAYSPEAAATTLGQLQGDASAAGCFSQVFLLFQAQRYQELWDRRDALTRSVPADQRDLLNFFLGRTAFALGNYKAAVDLLKPLLTEGSLATESQANERNIIALLVASAQKLGKAEWAEPWIRRFQDKYPSDPTLARLWLVQGEILRADGKLEDALAFVDLAADHASASEEKERASFQRLGILYDLGCWRECHQAGEEFLATFPASTYKIPVAKALVQATSKQLEVASLTNEEKALLQDRLSVELAALVRAPRALTVNEKSVYLLQTARVEYARKNLSGARAAAHQLINEYPGDKQLYQAHLVLAYTYYEDGSDLQAFIRHAETALLLKPDMADGDGVRLNLFAVYLQLAKDSGESADGQSGNMSRAADHLNAVVERGKTTVRPDNLLWLARYYYLHARNGRDDLVIEALPPSKRRDFAERALKVAQLASQPGGNRLDRLEDAVMLSQLYGWLGLLSERQDVIEATLGRQWPDSAQNRVQLGRLRLALAQTYDTLGQRDKAVAQYQELLTGKREGDALLRDYSQLQLARLRFSRIPADQRLSTSPEVMAVLNTLQTLQARRSVASEPVHLEASWERAHLSAEVAGKDTRNAALLNNLKQAKRDIVSEDDIVSRDYHAGRQENREVDRLYQAYLMLFDARIAQIEAEEAGKRKRVAEQRAKEQAAKTLYSTLLQDNFAVSKYLVSQAQSGLDEMR